MVIWCARIALASTLTGTFDSGGELNKGFGLSENSGCICAFRHYLVVAELRLLRGKSLIWSDIWQNRLTLVVGGSEHEAQVQSHGAHDATVGYTGGAFCAAHPRQFTSRGADHPEAAPQEPPPLPGEAHLSCCV